MANPNIVNVTDIRGKTAVVDLSTTNATLVVENVASSGKIFKLNSIIVSNVDGQVRQTSRSVFILKTTLAARQLKL
jgi:hypothetical protein